MEPEFQFKSRQAKEVVSGLRKRGFRYLNDGAGNGTYTGHLYLPENHGRFHWGCVIVTVAEATGSNGIVTVKATFRPNESNLHIDLFVRHRPSARSNDGKLGWMEIDDFIRLWHRIGRANMADIMADMDESR